MPHRQHTHRCVLQNQRGSFGIIRGASLVGARRSLPLHRSLERWSDKMSKLKTLKLEYEDYLRHQRGLSEKTIYDCWRFADRFLQFRFKDRDRELSKIV